MKMRGAILSVTIRSARCLVMRGATGGRARGDNACTFEAAPDPSHTGPPGKIATRSGAGTSFWSPELNRYYVAAPANEKEEAAILVFEPLPF